MGNRQLKWEIENGKWKMENGKWKMENGKWKMENGKWKKEKPNIWVILKCGTEDCGTCRSPEPSEPFRNKEILSKVVKL